jgi:hypothetical protein
MRLAQALERVVIETVRCHFPGGVDRVCFGRIA